MLAVATLCSIALTGCTQVGGCGYEITAAPLVNVDVRGWIKAHPDTNVRVCVDGNCLVGYNVVAVTGSDQTTTPLHDGDGVVLTVEPVQGSTAVETFTQTVRLVHDQCGQVGAWLRLDATGHLSPAPPE